MSNWQEWLSGGEEYQRSVDARNKAAEAESERQNRAADRARRATLEEAADLVESLMLRGEVLGERSVYNGALMVAAEAIRKRVTGEDQ